MKTIQLKKTVVTSGYATILPTVMLLKNHHHCWQEAKQQTTFRYSTIIDDHNIRVALGDTTCALR